MVINSTVPIKIAICQFETVQHPETVHLIENFNKAKNFIIQASQNHADLIIFPEYFITGIIENNLHLASHESKWINQFQELAAEYHIDIVPGTIVEEEFDQNYNKTSDRTTPPNLFNCAYYIDKSGRIINKYRKKNLWHSEKYLTPCENPNQVFEALNGVKIGMLICWDLAWPEAFRDLMTQKVDLIIIPSFWTLDTPDSKMIKYDPKGINESHLIDSFIISRALESESCIIFVNCAGKTEDGFLGRSAAAMPLKGSLIRLDDPEEKLAYVNIDLNVLKDAQEVYKVSDEISTKPFSKFYQ